MTFRFPIDLPSLCYAQTLRTDSQILLIHFIWLNVHSVSYALDSIPEMVNSINLYILVVRVSTYYTHTIQPHQINDSLHTSMQCILYALCIQRTHKMVENTFLTFIIHRLIISDWVSSSEREELLYAQRTRNRICSSQSIFLLN